MPIVRLSDRAVISVSGPDAESFLQNILTIDLATVQSGEARPGALLSPQGKILFDFLVSRKDGEFLLDCRSDVAADFARRLMLYRLRAKAEISVDDQAVVSISWNSESGGLDRNSGVFDRRFADGNVVRFYGETFEADSTLADWTAYRISQGVAESGDDYELGDAFPHDVLLDQNGGVGFRKGCYIGQEVVSRMQHRGTARRRVLIAHGDAALPTPGTPITVGGRSIGAVGSAAGQEGLALVRIDKVKAAMDGGSLVLAGEVPLTLTIPAWAKFGFPEAAAGSED